MGPQFGFRVVIVGQQVTQQVLFGTRDSFGAIFMGDTKAWQMLKLPLPVPPTPKRVGRFYMVQAGEVEVIQLICADPRGGAANERAWREFALGGRQEEAPWERTPPPWRAWFTRTEKPRKVREEISGPPGQREIPRVLLGHRAAADYAGMSYGTFMRRRGEHPVPGEFEDTVGGRKTACYTTGTLDLWRTELDE